jgi:hypothetical protein
MLLEAPQAASRATKYLTAAELAAPEATRREQLNVAMLRAWVDDDVGRTIRLCDQISDEFPQDLAIVKTHQYFEFNRGNAPEMLRVALKVGVPNMDVPYVHGVRSAHRAGYAAQGTLGAACAGARILDARAHG